MMTTSVLRSNLMAVFVIVVLLSFVTTIFIRILMFLSIFESSKVPPPSSVLGVSTIPCGIIGQSNHSWNSLFLVVFWTTRSTVDVTVFSFHKCCLNGQLVPRKENILTITKSKRRQFNSLRFANAEFRETKTLVSPLLKKAKQFIPKKYRPVTHVLFCLSSILASKTAGKVRQKLILQLNLILQYSSFQFGDVIIISNTNTEALFLWLSTAFLKGYLSGEKSDSQMALIDLDGEFLQISAPLFKSNSTSEKIGTVSRNDKMRRKAFSSLKRKLHPSFELHPYNKSINSCSSHRNRLSVSAKSRYFIDWKRIFFCQNKYSHTGVTDVNQQISVSQKPMKTHRLMSYFSQQTEVEGGKLDAIFTENSSLREFQTSLKQRRLNSTHRRFVSKKDFGSEHKKIWQCAIRFPLGIFAARAEILLASKSTIQKKNSRSDIPPETDYLTASNEIIKTLKPNKQIKEIITDTNTINNSDLQNEPEKNEFKVNVKNQHQQWVKGAIVKVKSIVDSLLLKGTTSKREPNYENENYRNNSKIIVRKNDPKLDSIPFVYNDQNRSFLVNLSNLNNISKSFELSDSNVETNLDDSSFTADLVIRNPDNQQSISREEPKMEFSMVKSKLKFVPLSQREFLGSVPTGSSKFRKSIQSTLKSSCIPIGSNGRFRINNRSFKIVGTANFNQSLKSNQCYNAIAIIIDKCFSFPSIGNADLIAIKSFYFMALQASLVKKGHSSGFVTPAQLKQYADKVCANEIPNIEDPLACMDYQFMVTLLLRGLKLPPKKLIQVAEEINGFKFSAALGAALQYLQEKS